MTASILSIPFATGIDQSLTTALGDPRITRMHNARLVAPGRVAVSPGYFSGVSPSGMRAIVQCDDKSVIIRSNNGLLTTASYVGDEATVYGETSEVNKWAQPAFEAPTRINLPAATAIWVAPTSSNHPHRWMALTVLVASVETPSLFLFHDQTLIQQVSITINSAVRYRLVTDYTDNSGQLVAYSTSAKTVSLYSVTTGDSPLSGSTSSAVGPASRMIDATKTTTGGISILCTLHENGTVLVWYPGLVLHGTITVGTDTVAIAMNGTELLCIRSTGYAQTYAVNSLAALSSATLVAVPASVVALSKSVDSGKYYLSLDTANASTGDADSYMYSIDSGTPSGALTVTAVSYQQLSAQPACAPLIDASGNPYQVTINDSPVSRSLQVSRVYTDSPLRTRRVATVAHGEMPTLATAARQGGIASVRPAATPQRIIVADNLCGEEKLAYVVPSIFVTSGTLTETTSLTAAMAIMFSQDATALADSTHCAVGFDALDVSRTQYGRVISSGSPFAIGARALCTGAAVDLPTPAITQGESGGGSAIFTPGQVYQYIVQYEYRAPDGTLFRGPPSQPITYTVVAPTAPSTTINSLVATIGFTEESPSMLGLRMRLYRTENGGSVFYDTGASSSPSGIGVYVLTDTSSDAALLGRQLLTDGPAVQNGIKARYGFPPHRCSWRGRDRTIVGGLENPRRVRWSLLAFPGEATAFPHASEQGWSADLPDDVTAVAQLDDAWIVFSRTRIWSIYGSGPDDNGLSGAFDPPRCVSPNLGCVTWKSIAEIESGLLFQAADGQIYLLTRGQNTLQWFSARVRDELNAGMLGTRITNPIVATIPNDAGQTVHFVRTTRIGSLASPLIVYDRRTDAWSTDGDRFVDGLDGAIGGASILDIFSTNRPGVPTVCTITPTALTIENTTGTPMPPIGATWTAYVETNDVSVFGLGGWGRVYKVGAIVEAAATVTITAQEWLSRFQGSPQCSGSLVYSDTASDFPFLSWAPPMDKCSAVRVRLTWTDTSVALVGLVLSAEASQGPQRLQTARKS